MKCSSSKSFEQCYNAQALVDEANQVIVAAHLTQQANDKGELKPAIEKLRVNPGDLPDGLKLSADAGYFSEDNVKAMEQSQNRCPHCGGQSETRREAAAAQGPAAQGYDAQGPHAPKAGH
jgi:hypothetical protein